MRIAYLDCFSGISGDMTIAAFLDAGFSFTILSKELAKLKIKGYRLKVSKVKRGGIAGTKFDCITDERGHGHRSLKDIFAIIDKSSLNNKVKATAKNIFTDIGRAEAKVHGTGGKKGVYLHELGEIDSIIDIVGIAIILDVMGIDEIYASVVNQGRTFAGSAHGTIPIPGPAALELLRGIPTGISDVRAELVTPTGAGILRSLAKGFGRMPQMVITDIGYGAGTMEFKEMPNMLRVAIGQASDIFKEDRIHIIDTNIDDMNPQNFEYLFERLFKEGALDVYTTAIQMKKSRPAIKLTVLARHKDLNGLSSIIFEETTTIGLRFYEAGRMMLDREMVAARTKFGTIRVKVSRFNGKPATISPEYNDCIKIARLKRVPFRVVYDTAKSACKPLTK